MNSLMWAFIAVKVRTYLKSADGTTPIGSLALSILSRFGLLQRRTSIFHEWHSRSNSHCSADVRPCRKLRICHSLAIALAGLSMLTVMSCRHAKNAQKSETTTPPGARDTTLAQSDTSKSGLSKAYDSLSGKVSNFFQSLLPPKEDTTKGQPVLTPPPPEITPPTVAGEPPSEPGFLRTPVQRKLEFDSSGNVIEHDTYLGGDVRSPQSYSFSEYLAHAQEDELTQSFEDMMHKQFDTGKTVEATTGLLGDYNSIQIPIPPSVVPTIFGRPSINLRITGDVGVHLAYRDNETYATSGANFFGSEKGLDFKQEINVSTNGTIGDKLKIGADWGSDRQFQFDNLLKFNYQGFSDEILQEFDAGNVTFNTPSQYIGLQDDLFGLKAITRFGPVYITALAAQKKGERQTRSFGSGNGIATEHLIKPWEYRRNRFFLDTSFAQYYEAYYSTIPPNSNAITGSGKEYVDYKSVQVWVSTTVTTSNYKNAIAFYNLPGRSPSQSYTGKWIDPKNAEVSGIWLKMDTSRYYVEPYSGVIVFNQEPEDNNSSIAVSYTTVNKGVFTQYGDPENVANNNTSNNLVLRLLKPQRTYQGTSSEAWNNILKNSYYIGGVGFSPEGFTGRVMYQEPNGHQNEYYRTASKPLRAISVLGLDRYNNSSAGNKTADGLVDYSQQLPGSYIVDPRTGTLVFPYLQPFGKRVLDFDSTQKRLNSAYQYDTTYYMPEIYNQSQEVLRYHETKQVQIGMTFSGGVSSTLFLNAFNLVEGSVKVTVNGTPLVENTDYRVDYASGTVTILNTDLLSTGTINVEYDVHDIFSNATKNILGFRAEVPILDHGVIGTTFMNYSMSLPTLKTRQGEEPMSNWIWGIDGSYKVDAPGITDVLNALPFFNLKDKSEFSVRADAALSLPNPNTQASPFPEDNKASIAYLDDFEGGLNQFPLYMSYGRWHPSSQPFVSDAYSLKYAAPTPDTPYWNDPINKMKGKMWWYWPSSAIQGFPPPVLIHDITPNKQTANLTDQAQVMDIAFDPTKPGIYNPYPEPINANFPLTDRWGGLMQYTPGLNVAATNTDAIEMWVHINGTIDPSDLDNAVLRFDMGRISEDVIPDRVLETEDKILNGRYDPGEDVGLDSLSNDSEKVKFPGAFNPSDPSNDDYNANTPDGQSGQDNNSTDAQAGLTPDTEDLDGNAAVNLDDDYYEYNIPLDLAKNPFVIGNTNQTWYQLRIPISDFSKIVGVQDSSFGNISYFRFWIKDVNHPIDVQLYEVQLVGSQWTRGAIGLNSQNPIADTTLRVNYIDIEDNGGAPTFYYPPANTQRPISPGGTSSTTYLQGNEQSLNLQLTNVEPTDVKDSIGRRQAERIFPTPNDIFNYKAMAVWVHGDTLPGTQVPAQPFSPGDTIWVYWRFGTDQFNYYEYKRPLVRGWQNMHVDFGTLTALKAARLPQLLSATELANDGVPGSRYTVVGSPNLTNAPYFVLGASNHTGRPLTTDIWWDEMRLLDANDQPGFAYNASARLKLAEFGQITAGMVNEDADFHRVDERFNTTRSQNITWNVTGEFGLQKMLPKWMEDAQTKLPITISHAESIIRPKYIVNTDVALNDAITAINSGIASGKIPQAAGQAVIDSLNLNNETLQVKNSFGASDIELRFPGSFFLIPAFVNRLTFGFGYAETYFRSPQYEFDRTWSWTGSARYTLPALPHLNISPLTWMGTSTLFVGPYSVWKIDPLPSNVSFAVSATRGRDHSLNRLSTLTLPPEGSTYQDTLDVLNSRVPLINRTFTATRGMGLNWKPFEGGVLSPGFEYALDVQSNLVPLETQAQYNRPVTYDQNGNPIYNYDSIYLYQRSVSQIMHDIFFNNGALVRPDVDFNSSQKLHMATTPKLPGLFGLEKLVRPVFDYRVEYRWLNAQTGLQNAKQSAWNNTITTGLEFNLRDLGILLFGKPIGEEQGGVQRGGPRERGQVGVTPEELPNGHGGEERESPFPKQREEPRNQVTRGEDMRPQSQPNPLQHGAYITDTMHRPAFPPPIDTTGKIHSKGVGTQGQIDREYAIDTTLTPEAPPELQPVQPVIAETPLTTGETVKKILQAVIQKPLFDWNGTRFNFTETNQSINGALAGDGSGITNFLARGFFAPESDQNGPSRAYQLGLITDPSGRLIFHWKPQFPFLDFSTRHGLRAPDPNGGSVDITDAFTQLNNFELATSRPLWAGATININWKLAFGFDERDALHIDDLGNPTLDYSTKTGNVSRTFFSIPPLPFIGSGITQSGILRVGEKYREMVIAAGAANVDTARVVLSPTVHNQIEQQAFMQGFETLPFFTSFLREYLPRANYSFSWTGLEKFPLFSFADHASFRNAYTGTYSRSFQQNPGDSITLTSLQTIIYGFRPLIALDMSWDKFQGGRLTTSLNYDTQTQWAADYASTRITKRLSTTFGVTANYQRQGLNVPFLNLTLKNEFGATFALTETISSDSYYNFWNISADNIDGTSNGGLTKTTIEPRISYSVSQQLTIEAFYHYERTTPASSGLISPPTRLIMAGFDVHLKIQ
ncbi:MAG TPA: cell surface protein SprA [Candidatus Kapabacteria bacterium]|nr:cell surface protein SprA [Candidatus Kapabacteria bacterium]